MRKIHVIGLVEKTDTTSSKISLIHNIESIKKIGDCDASMFVFKNDNEDKPAIKHKNISIKNISKNLLKLFRSLRKEYDELIVLVSEKDYSYYQEWFQECSGKDFQEFKSCMILNSK
jgi:hypothetical protein